MLKNTTHRYGLLSKTLHWVMAVMIIALIVVGLYMTGLDKEDPSRMKIYSMHKAMGTLVLILLIVRLAWLRATPAPMLPGVFSLTQKRVTETIRSLLYLLMALMPISGYVMSVAAGHPVSFFGLFDLPVLFEKSKPLAGFAHEIHEMMGYAILAFVLLHVAGAIKNRVAHGGSEADLMQRML